MPFRFSLLLCALATGTFYLWQNHFATQGGHIALPKALWLGLTLYYWLILPPLVFSAAYIGKRLRRAYLLFWLPMLARAIIELYMLYGTNTWHYRYGIIHDLFSAALLMVLYRQCRHETPRLWRHTLLVMAVMFLFEAGFAYYISHFNQSLANAELWFIGWEAPHLPNQLITLACVIFLTAWLIILERRTS